MTVKTGPLAAIGLQMEVGLVQLLKERNNMLAGRKVELYTVDSAATPAIAKTKLQELIQRDKVHVVIGPLAAFEALAIDDQIREAKMPIISSSAAAEDLTQRKFNPWFVRATATSAQSSHPLGEYAAKVLGYKRMAIFADDFAYTQEVSSGFQRVFEDNGGKIVQKLWTPINAPDYAPYLAQIKKDIDGIFLGSAGSNSLRFLRQQVEFGLKIPVVGAQTVTDEAILRNMGDEALGVITTRWYSAAIDTPANKKFVAEHVRANGYEPGTFSAGGYSAGLFLEQGLIDAKGNIEDKEEFMRRLRTMTLTTDPRGAVALRRIRQPDPDDLHHQGRAHRRQAGQLGRRHLSGRQPVLEIQSEGIPRQSGLFAQLAAGEISGVITDGCRHVGRSPRVDRLPDVLRFRRCRCDSPPGSRSA